MNLREELLIEHSKAQASMIADWIGEDATRFRELVRLFLHDEYRVSQRAAWVVGIMGERHPELVSHFLPQLVARMSDPEAPVAVRRNVMRILQYIVLPEDLHGSVMHLAFSMLENPVETIAVRAFAMSVLGGLARIYPDIKGEIRLLLTDMLAQEGTSAGLRARARMVLKDMEKPYREQISPARP